MHALYSKKTNVQSLKKSFPSNTHIYIHTYYGVWSVSKLDIWEMRAFSCMIVACRTVFQKDAHLFQKIIHVSFTEMGPHFIHRKGAIIGPHFIHKNGAMFWYKKWDHVSFRETGQHFTHRKGPHFIHKNGAMFWYKKWDHVSKWGNISLTERGHISFTKMGPCFSSRNGFICTKLRPWHQNNNMCYV